MNTTQFSTFNLETVSTTMYQRKERKQAKERNETELNDRESLSVHSNNMLKLK